MNILDRDKFTSFYKSLKEKDFTQCRSSASLFIPNGRLLTVPEGATPFHSGVMIMCYPENGELNLVFIRRTEDGRAHSGQIAFPGGRFEPDSDKDTVDTAIRESEEEVGSALNRKDVLCHLTPLYIPPSGFLVDPYLMFLDEKPVLKASPDEVAEILHIPFSCFLKNESILQSEFSTITGKVQAPCWVWGDVKIWGATAIIMSELGCLERRRREDLG